MHDAKNISTRSNAPDIRLFKMPAGLIQNRFDIIQTPKTFEYTNAIHYLRNRPQVSLGYRLINHAGCWQNTRRICESRAIETCRLLLLCNNSDDARFFRGFTGTITHN